MSKKTIDSNITTLYDEAESAHREVRGRGFAWDEREEFFYGRYKSSKENTKSVYSTGELQGMVIDSACRVMAQMATGRFTSIADDDIANVIAANLVYHHHILPNANTGGDFFTKNRQVNIYSKVYGTMPAYIDWIVSDRYTGPDLVLVHPRRFRPQPGKYAIEDMDHCFVETTVSKRWLEDRAKNPKAKKIWNIEGVQESELDNGSLTTEERKATQGKKLIVLRHYFNRDGDWIIYNPAGNAEVVNQKRYFPCIPLIDKQTIPVLDRYWGLGDYERGETPQKSLDTMIRLFLDGWEYSNEPPLIMDPEEVVLSSIVRQPKAKWFVKDGKINAIQPVNVNPRSLEMFQGAYNIIKANLLSLSAQTDTSVSKSVDVGFGKTPEALRQQAQREGSRDAWDRYMQERFLEKAATMMMRIAIHRGMDGVKIRDIQSALGKIKSSYPEKDLSIFQNGVIRKDYLKGTLRYEVDPGSTMKRDNAGERLIGILSYAEKNPKIEESLAQSGKRINWGEALKRAGIDEGIQDWDKIIVDAKNPESVEGVGDSESTVVTAENEDPNADAPAPVNTPKVTPEQIAQIAQTL
jgi:hypothetical protein